MYDDSYKRSKKEEEKAAILLGHLGEEANAAFCCQAINQSAET